WPHNTGPLMTYLASCGSTTCDKFDSTKAKWFKIDQQGQDASGKWIQAELRKYLYTLYKSITISDLILQRPASPSQ
ncbi:Cellulose-growth-specific protein, partial [Termitomyces sp. J132]